MSRDAHEGHGNPVAASGNAAYLRSGVRGAGAPSGQNGFSSRMMRPIKIAAFPEAWCGKPCMTVGEKPDWDHTRVKIHTRVAKWREQTVAWELTRPRTGK